MTIRQSFLAILDQGPCYGYQLRAEFERRTGATWPLNLGQVYTTLDRLERDGLIERDEASSLSGDGDQIYYRITSAGHDEVAAWLERPVARTTAAPRDELSMKLAIAVTLPGVDIVQLIQTQRAATFRVLQELTRAKHASGPVSSPPDLAWQLVADSLLFQAEAEIRWLDHSEQILVALARSVGGPSLPGTETAVGQAAPALPHEARS